MAKKILIVDDEEDLLAMMVLRLRSSGYVPLKAASGEEALDILGKNKPDLIILDLLLPNMQGSEVCKKLKLDPKFKDIPIIVFTASITRITEKTEAMGADDYILKPFEPSDLIFKIKKFIG